MFLLSSIYYYYSLSFIVVRSSIMFLVAAGIAEVSRMPMKIVRSIPREGWCFEVSLEGTLGLDRVKNQKSNSSRM
jgi:ABC-type uncharacterized transport system permease subunit